MKYTVHTMWSFDTKFTHIYGCPSVSQVTLKRLSKLLQWRYNEGDGVSSHRCLGYLLNRLFRRGSKKGLNFRHCEKNPPVTGGFPSQRASNAENVSILWRHHVNHIYCWYDHGQTKHNITMCIINLFESKKRTRLIICVTQSLITETTI